MISVVSGARFVPEADRCDQHHVFLRSYDFSQTKGQEMTRINGAHVLGAKVSGRHQYGAGDCRIPDYHSSRYSSASASGDGTTQPASRRARMCSITSRCSVTRSVATATTTGYRRSSSSGDTSTRSRVSRKVRSIHWHAGSAHYITMVGNPCVACSVAPSSREISRTMRVAIFR